MPTKFRIEITLSAERDVEEIWAYSADQNPTRASLFISELERQTLTLEQHPERCPIIPEIGILGIQYRHLLFENYRTIFRITKTTVFILRIIHGSKLLDSTMFED